MLPLHGKDRDGMKERWALGGLFVAGWSLISLVFYRKYQRDMTEWVKTVERMRGSRNWEGSTSERNREYDAGW